MLGVLVMELELFGEWASGSEKQMTIVDYGISTLAYTVDAEFLSWEVSKGLKK